MKRIICIILSCLLMFAMSVSAFSDATEHWVQGQKIENSDILRCLYIPRLPIIFKKSATFLGKTVSAIAERNAAENITDEIWDGDWFEPEEPSIYEPVAEEPISSCTVCVEAFTVGGGYIAEPITVELEEGETAAAVLVGVLENKGLECGYSGEVTDGFYLWGISGLGGFKPSIYPGLREKLESDEFFVNETDYIDAALGEFDFTQGAGWLYCVNNNFPDVGMSDYFLQNGDVMRVQYTLAFGADIGGSNLGEVNNKYYENPNRDELTKKIAERGLSAFQAYSNLIIRPDITADEIETILSDIN